MGLPSAYRLPELIQKLAVGVGVGMGGEGLWEALQLLTHYYKEIAVLFNYPSLKKHAGLAFFFFFPLSGSKDTIVEPSPAPKRRSL